MISPPNIIIYHPQFTYLRIFSIILKAKNSNHFMFIFTSVNTSHGTKKVQPSLTIDFYSLFQ
jgi:hypothetical protein